MLKLAVMCSEKADCLCPDVVVHEEMKDAVHVDAVHSTDRCDVIQMLIAILLADGLLM